MFNKLMLEKEIENSGLKRGFIAKRMGFTPQGLSKKINENRLTTDEADNLCEIIGISSRETKCEIFFATNVDINGNNI